MAMKACPKCGSIHWRFVYYAEGQLAQQVTLDEGDDPYDDVDFTGVQEFQGELDDPVGAVECWNCGYEIPE